jgi:hypothetical protein
VFLHLAGAADGTVSAWNMSSRPGTLVRSLKCEKYVTCVQLVDDIKLATSSADGKVSGCASEPALDTLPACCLGQTNSASSQVSQEESTSYTSYTASWGRAGCWHDMHNDMLQCHPASWVG